MLPDNTICHPKYPDWCFENTGLLAHWKPTNSAMLLKSIGTCTDAFEAKGYVHTVWDTHMNLKIYFHIKTHYENIRGLLCTIVCIKEQKCGREGKGEGLSQQSFKSVGTLDGHSSMSPHKHGKLQGKYGGLEVTWNWGSENVFDQISHLIRSSIILCGPPWQALNTQRRTRCSKQSFSFFSFNEITLLSSMESMSLKWVKCEIAWCWLTEKQKQKHSGGK